MATIYPLTTFHFTVTWGGTRIGFTEVSGLKYEQEVVEFRHGAMLEHGKIKMPGQKKFGNITLKRGVIPLDNEFMDWLNQTKMTTPDRRDITISLLNEEHAPVMTWKVKNCFPVSVEAPGMKADGNEVAIETIEIAHEGFTLSMP